MFAKVLNSYCRFIFEIFLEAAPNLKLKIIVQTVLQCAEMLPRLRKRRSDRYQGFSGKPHDVRAAYTVTNAKYGARARGDAVVKISVSAYQKFVQQLRFFLRNSFPPCDIIVREL